MAAGLLNDIAHWVGTDIQTSPTGDLGLASGDLRTQQRIIRRLVTNPGDYIFNPTYGAGLPSKIGLVLDLAGLSVLIRSQIRLEDGVAQIPEPQVAVTAGAAGAANAVGVHIRYSSTITRRAVVLAFNVNA